MTIGPAVGGTLHRRFRAKRLVFASLGFTIVAALLATWGAIAPFPYPFLRLVLASVCPMGPIWFTVLCPSDSDGLVLIILFKMTGGITGPGAKSAFASLSDIHAARFVIAGIAAHDVADIASALQFQSPPAPRGAVATLID